jgi:hypothetical protein
MARRSKAPTGGAPGDGGTGSASVSGSHRGLLGVGLAAAALGALVLVPTPAHAQPFGPGACGGACFYADNSTETFFYNGLGVSNIGTMEWARARIEYTDMTTQLQTSSFNNDTDIVTYDDNYATSSWWGWWACDVLVSGSSTKCNRGHVLLNLRFGNAPYALTCQEVGHGVGLDHSTSTGSCMYPYASQAASDFDSHDKGHINGYY